MGVLRHTVLRVAVGGSISLLPFDADGQDPAPAVARGANDSASTVVPGRHYGAEGFKRTVFGAGWRDLWVTPVSVPSLDIGTYAGGLKVLERGGGYQTITLHLQEDGGWKEYRFRSVNKFPVMTLPSPLRETAAGRIIQDQVSSVFPGAPAIVPPLLEAIKAIAVDAPLYRLADSPRLGVYRDTVAGMLGTMELKGDEAPNGAPGWLGSKKITGTEGFLEDLRSKRVHQFDEREFLGIRLVDLLINDSDRTPDNSDWARFGDSTGYTWRSIARDRDWAFIDARGWINQYVGRPLYPKIVAFDPAYDLKGLTYSSHFLDRQLLQRLTRDDFATIAAQVKAAITDDVIEQVIAKMPSTWRAQTAAPARLRALLRTRRDAIPEVAMAFYALLATDVDLYGTDDDDHAEIVRHPDGRVTVTIGGDEHVRATASSPEGSQNAAVEGAAPSSPFYQRTFLPAETKEVRLYLLGGADHASVRGAASKSIAVRIIGGHGDDVLADSAGGGATHLYDADGKNELVASSGTKVDRRPWIEPQVSHGMRFWSSWAPDWGGTGGWSPTVSHGQGAGVIVGVSRGVTSYGFRRLPHEWAIKGTALLGTGNGRFALRGDADYRRENSPVAFTLSTRASQLEAFRFYGYGNDTPHIDRSVSLVNQTVLAFEPAVVMHLGWRARELETNEEAERAGTAKHTALRAIEGKVTAGPVVSWIDPDAAGGSPLATLADRGNSSFGHVGLKASVDFDRTDVDAVPMRGWRLHADVSGFPPLWDLSQSFTRTQAEGSVYVPLIPNSVHLAVRGGASMASGLVPAQYAASLGGWKTLRGYSSQRFSGDAAVDGSTELRVPVGTVNLFVRWDAGVFGLADVGRVWYAGESEGKWHTGFGGGVWLSALGKAISFAYARGDEHRFYLKTGLF